MEQRERDTERESERREAHHTTTQRSQPNFNQPHLDHHPRARERIRALGACCTHVNIDPLTAAATSCAHRGSVRRARVPDI